MIEWRPDELGQLRPFLPDMPGVRVAWAPQPGSQTEFLRLGIPGAVPGVEVNADELGVVTEALYAGPRGFGKSDALLMDFVRGIYDGLGADWNGVLFRKTYPELRDIEERSIRWFREMFPSAEYNRSAHRWRWPTGEQLEFSYMASLADYDRHHGHQKQWIGWEELTNWASPECYELMLTTLRSANRRAAARMRVRSTANPGGVGHNWVKARFQLPLPPGTVVGPLIRNPDRIVVLGRLEENKVLLHADPHYAERIAAAAGSETRRKAWVEGSWDIVAGGMLDDLWTPEVHVVPPIPPAAIPASWRLDRSYDDGQSRPFSVGWWAESDGTPITWEGRVIGSVRGDLIRVQEWYGWNGTPNEGLRLASREIAAGIVEREQAWGVAGRVRPGPADTSIFNADPRDPSSSIASEMRRAGVSWEPADKRAGSRKLGWQQIRSMLKAALPGPEGRREHPGLFVSAVCQQFLRTIPVLPRSERDPDDVDTDAEDHIADETRYRARRHVAPPTNAKRFALF